MNRYARIDDKEKLRMAKNLVKSNNKKIKKALEVIDVWFDDRFQLDILDWKLMKDDLAKIKKRYPKHHYPADSCCFVYCRYALDGELIVIFIIII